MLKTEIILSGPWPRISLVTADPPETVLKLTFKAWRSHALPSQLPGRFWMAVYAFSASVWARAEVAANVRAKNISDRVRSDFGMAVFLSAFDRFILVCGRLASPGRAQLLRKFSGSTDCSSRRC